MPGIQDDESRLHRDVQPMPDDVLSRLTGRDLLDAYHERPAYHRNDWLG